MIEVLFVCLGNICRSPMAEYIFKDMVKKEGMEERNVINIKRIMGENKENKIYRLFDFSKYPRDIADPWYTGNFNTTY